MLEDSVPDADPDTACLRCISQVYFYRFYFVKSKSSQVCCDFSHSQNILTGACTDLLALS